MTQIISTESYAVTGESKLKPKDFPLAWVQKQNQLLIVPAQRENMKERAVSEHA